jgi:hypothetical protein
MLYKWMKFNGVPVFFLKNWFMTMGYVFDVPITITPELENYNPTEEDFSESINSTQTYEPVGGKRRYRRTRHKAYHKKRKATRRHR